LAFISNRRNKGMEARRRVRLWWTIPPGLALLTLAALSELVIRWLHIAPSAVSEFEAPLFWLEHAIWQNKRTFYTPSSVTMGGDPPSWLHLILFIGWILLVPFGVGVCVGDVARLLFAAKRPSPK
jgi:hypothetical protein